MGPAKTQSFRSWHEEALDPWLTTGCSAKTKRYYVLFLLTSFGKTLILISILFSMKVFCSEWPYLTETIFFIPRFLFSNNQPKIKSTAKHWSPIQFL